MRPVVRWAPTVLLGVGAVLTVGVDLQRSLSLRMPLGEAIPLEIAGAAGTDIRLSDAEIRVAGVTDYLLRSYAPLDSVSASSFTLYVGYYESQVQGKTIHSPKNCLPGAGWEALAAGTIEVQSPHGPVHVNRYLLRNRGTQALVFYWYQGRGRVAHNEYAVKWDLLRDSAIRQRSDEALVRIVVPLRNDDDVAEFVAVQAAERVIPAVFEALPE